jgi:hypothetical protein
MESYLITFDQLAIHEKFQDLKLAAISEIVHLTRDNCRNEDKCITRKEIVSLYHMLNSIDYFNGTSTNALDVAFREDSDKRLRSRELDVLFETVDIYRVIPKGELFVQPESSIIYLKQMQILSHLFDEGICFTKMPNFYRHKNYIQISLRAAIVYESEKTEKAAYFTTLMIKALRPAEAKRAVSSP